MQIPLPTNQKPDIFSFGFDKNLNIPIQNFESPLVYNQIEERLSQMVQSNNSVANSVNGLPLSNFDPMQKYTPTDL